MKWGNKELRTAGEITEAFATVQTLEGARSFVLAYQKSGVTLDVAISNLRFGLDRFYADGLDDLDPRAIKACQLQEWLRNKLMRE